MSRPNLRIGRYRSSIVALCLALGASPVLAAPTEGDIAPDYAGVATDGEHVAVSTFAGKVVVLSFWASWCGPCRKELPILEGMQHAGKGRLQVIAVNIESSDVFKKIAPNSKSLEMMVASDAGGSAQKSYGVHGIPHMVIIGKDGRVLHVHRGYSSSGVDDAIADLNQALAQ